MRPKELYKKLGVRLKKIFHFSDRKKYLWKLVKKIEREIEADRNLPFKIQGIKKHGFLVKTYGLYAYVPFNYMPWNYPNENNWKTVFPSIKGKVFFGKVLQLNKDPLSIKLHAKVAQFKRPELIENEFYRGIVINKTIYGLFVDIGYHFDWKCGSKVGLLHRYNCRNKELINTKQNGDEIKVCFWGFNEQSKLVFADNSEWRAWYTGDIYDLVGKYEWVEVRKNENGKLSYLVRGKQEAILPIKKNIYQEQRKKVNQARYRLKNGDVIYCEIIALHPKRKVLVLKADLDSLPQSNGLEKDSSHVKKFTSHYAIGNHLDDEILEKLKRLKDQQ